MPEHRQESGAAAKRNYRDGGEAILEAFRALGVDHVVCSPGSEWSPLWEALTRQQIEKRKGPGYLNCNHETLAVNVATGYTAVTRRLQAVLLHAGAGLLQGAMGIQGAQLGGLPMLILSGESLTYGEDPSFDPGFQWQASLSVVGGPQRFVEPLVKWGSQATSRFTLYDTVLRAGEMARRTPMGPTYVDVPFEIMLEEWTPPAAAFKASVPPKPVASEDDVETVAKLLAASRNPLIVTESAGRDPEGFAALVALAESLAIPVIEAGNCADVANFPTDHALHQGFNAKSLLEEADVVLVVSARMPWYPSASGPKNARIVVIDDNPFAGQMVYQNLRPDVLLEGDVASSLQRLAAATRVGKANRSVVDDRRAHWTAASSKARNVRLAAEAELRGKKPIDPAALCVALREAMPGNAVYVDETTTHRGLIQRHLGWSSPQSYFYVHGGLGQGLGTALGVKLALPERPVALLIGDGAFMYNPANAALGLAREAKLPILIVVFCNNGYAAMRNNQRRFYPDGAGVAANQFHGGGVQGCDYAELAKLFDGYGERVEDPAQLGAALGRGLAAVEDGRTAILNVQVSR